MTPIDYHCKICRVGRVAYYDEACPIHKIELWRQSLCCDRCYEFRDEYTKTKRRIQSRCIQLAQANELRDYQTRSAAQSKVKDSLTMLTKRTSKLCSDYYHVQDIWDVEMVQVLMDNPIGCNKAIDRFHSEFRKIAFNSKHL